MKVRILHNPRCSKSRQTLALLSEKGIDAEVVEYLKTPPAVDELKRIATLLAVGPRDMMRKKEAPYTQQKLDDDSVSDQALFEAMVRNPILIERPIVIANGKAAIGRPPEKVLEIL